ncbi:hypothetical protein CALVIDRAFT_344948 [Calocera viscosa TUFC12733]|uniref:Secreted protein n=1 Tax=Calocera viscosa (strain TUFC12733) TaxID=1330018 RepID=A0A167HDX8_CALVF|nr:hypothetical protein CALVIDRAFT_344948 [Calocera viscosa TUFC12733]
MFRKPGAYLWHLPPWALPLAISATPCTTAACLCPSSCLFPQCDSRAVFPCTCRHGHKPSPPRTVTWTSISRAVPMISPRNSVRARKIQARVRLEQSA